MSTQSRPPTDSSKCGRFRYSFFDGLRREGNASCYFKMENVVTQARKASQMELHARAQDKTKETETIQNSTENKIGEENWMSDFRAFPIWNVSVGKARKLHLYGDDRATCYKYVPVWLSSTCSLHSCATLAHRTWRPILHKKKPERKESSPSSSFVRIKVVSLAEPLRLSGRNPGRNRHVLWCCRGACTGLGPHCKRKRLDQRKIKQRT